jgi:hypothetical protein
MSQWQVGVISFARAFGTGELEIFTRHIYLFIVNLKTLSIAQIMQREKIE